MTAIPHPLTGTHEDAHDHAHSGHHELPFVSKYVFSTDHKVIGIQFLMIGLLFMVLGGLLAMLVRWQLAWPDNSERGLVGKQEGGSFDYPLPVVSLARPGKLVPGPSLGQHTDEVLGEL